MANMHARKHVMVHCWAQPNNLITPLRCGHLTCKLQSVCVSIYQEREDMHLTDLQKFVSVESSMYYTYTYTYNSQTCALHPKSMAPPSGNDCKHKHSNFQHDGRFGFVCLG